MPGSGLVRLESREAWMRRLVGMVGSWHGVCRGVEGGAARGELGAGGFGGLRPDSNNPLVHEPVDPLGDQTDQINRTLTYLH